MLKYKKGTFNTVPNKDYLKGKPAEMQSVYFWIVDHANEEGKCFPGRVTLAKESGCNVKTVDTYLKRLIDEGFISKEQRPSKGKKGLSSNMYQLLFLDIAEKEVLPVLPSALPENGSPALPENGAVTIPNELYPITIPNTLPAKPSKSGPFIFIEKMDKLRVSNWKPDKILHLYFTRKNLVFENKKQWDLAYGRFKKSAMALEGYSSSQIWQTFDYCDIEMKNIPWNLGTVVKVISNVVNKK